jgi:hypothetical protein
MNGAFTLIHLTLNKSKTNLMPANEPESTQSLMNEHGRLLKIGEVSRILNIYADTVRLWSDLGVLKPVQTGQPDDPRFRLEDVVTFLPSGQPDAKELQIPRHCLTRRLAIRDVSSQKSHVKSLNSG